MTATSTEYTFGPVPSRRLGKSLGINNIPAKVCSYSCVYCQIGRTTELQMDRNSFYAPSDIVDAVKSKVSETLEAGEVIDYLTFVADGEPTLDENIGREIQDLKPLGIPIGVITNSSLIWRDDVRKDLAHADWVSLKIDALWKALWRKIDRPNTKLVLEAIHHGILDFAASFKGKLVTETMLVAGLNDGEDHLIKLSDFIEKLQPDTAYLSIPTRPPAVQWVHAPSEARLNRAFQLLSASIDNVEYLIGYEGDAFAYSGDVEKDILSITAVHPMRMEAVDALLTRAGASWETIDHLVAQGDLTVSEYGGHRFYLRKLK